MRRRELITLLGGAAAAWPLAVRAQQPAMPVVGYLGGGVPETTASHVAGFRRGLRETGFVEGQNVTIEYRWANNQQDRLPALAAELVHRPVAVIAAVNTTPGAIASKAATATIPIVFSVGNDPIQAGLVASINQPGGNATGIYYISSALGEKRLGLVRELIPGVDRVAMLVNPDGPVAEATTKDVQSAASTVAQRVEIFHARNSTEIDTAFAALMRAKAGALLVSPDTLFGARRVQLVSLAARHALPAIYSGREYAEAGGLITYGTSLTDAAHQVGVYAGRVLKGAKPADLPVMQPTRFELVINLQTAKLIGLVIPTTLLALADELIE